jgi:hypothetical protein
MPTAFNAFFLVKEPTKPKAKPEAKPRRPGLNKYDQAAIRAYQRASPAERKALLRDQVTAEEQAKFDAFRRHRRDYMAQYRAMRRMATCII